MAAVECYISNTNHPVINDWSHNVKDDAYYCANCVANMRVYANIPHVAEFCTFIRAHALKKKVLCNGPVALSMLKDATGPEIPPRPSLSPRSQAYTKMF